MDRAKYLIFLMVLVMAPPSYARNREELIPGSRYNSARSAGMGDTIAPFADDTASALFANPAGLGKIRDSRIEPLNLVLETNGQYVGKINKKGQYQAVDLKSYVPTLTRFPGFSPMLGAQLTPNWGFRGFGVGVLLSQRISASSDERGQITYRSHYQLIPSAGFALRLASGVLRMGYSFQWVNQAGGSATVASSASTLGYSEGIQEGSAFSHNAGFALTLPYTYLPSLNFVAHNIGGARYRSTKLWSFAASSTGLPDDELMTMDASLGYQNKIGMGATLATSVVYRDMTNRSDSKIWGRAAFGFELMFRDSFFLRGGWSSMAPNAGLGIKTRRSELSLGWYDVDVGDTYHALKDRRYMLQYQIRAF